MKTAHQITPSPKSFFGGALFSGRDPIAREYTRSRMTKTSSFKMTVITLCTALCVVITSVAFVLFAAASPTSAAPAPFVISPVQGQEIASPMPVIVGAAPAASEALVFIDGRLNGAATVLDGSFSYVPFLPLSSGGHAIQLQSRDAETGQLSERSAVTLITVIPHPAPVLLAPGTGVSLGQDRAWVGGVVKNGSLVRVLVDGVESARTQAKNHPSGSASFGVRLSGLSAGEHVVTAIARDSQGKESFASDPITITVLPPTPAPVLFRPVVNADSGIERPFIRGVAKSGFVVSIVIDGKIEQRIPLGADVSGAVGFSYQPERSLSLGRHTIEAFASDNGKLSNNSKPQVWQVGSISLAPNGSVSADDSGQASETGGAPSLSVSEPEDAKPLTVADRLDEASGGAPGPTTAEEEPETPVVPDVVSEEPIDPGATQGRVIADDDAVLGETDGLGALAQLDEGAEGAADGEDGVIDIAPGAVVRQQDPDVAGGEFTLNTSLVIGIVILIFLLLSILVWYIQEKRAQLGERVVSIFREEEDEPGKESGSSDSARLPGDAGQESRDSDKLPGDMGSKPREKGGSDDLPPPPPPMF